MSPEEEELPIVLSGSEVAQFRPKVVGAIDVTGHLSVRDPSVTLVPHTSFVIGLGVTKQLRAVFQTLVKRRISGGGSFPAPPSSHRDPLTFAYDNSHVQEKLKATAVVLIDVIRGRHRGGMARYGKGERLDGRNNHENQEGGEVAEARRIAHEEENRRGDGGSHRGDRGAATERRSQRRDWDAVNRDDNNKASPEGMRSANAHDAKLIADPCAFDYLLSSELNGCWHMQVHRVERNWRMVGALPDFRDDRGGERKEEEAVGSGRRNKRKRHDIPTDDKAGIVVGASEFQEDFVVLSLDDIVARVPPRHPIVLWLGDAIGLGAVGEDLDDDRGSTSRRVLFSALASLDLWPHRVGTVIVNCIDGPRRMSASASRSSPPRCAEVQTCMTYRYGLVFVECRRRPVVPIAAASDESLICVFLNLQTPNLENNRDPRFPTPPFDNATAVRYVDAQDVTLPLTETCPPVA